MSEETTGVEEKAVSKKEAKKERKSRRNGKTPTPPAKPTEKMVPEAKIRNLINQVMGRRISEEASANRAKEQLEANNQMKSYFKGAEDILNTLLQEDPPPSEQP